MCWQLADECENTGRDCGSHWRLIRRLHHALHRHCQDQAARCATCAEVQLNETGLLGNIARRGTQGPLWRSDSDAIRQQYRRVARFSLMSIVPGQMLFFSSYEYSKRYLVNIGVQDFMAYLVAGLVGDLFASAIYVPSEVP